jgi:hypothetical protein
MIFGLIDKNKEQTHRHPDAMLRMSLSHVIFGLIDKNIG